MVVSVGQIVICIIVCTVNITTSLTFTCSTGACVVIEKSIPTSDDIHNIFLLFGLLDDLCLVSV